MSSRDPMWFCHECNAEMRPLLVPYPVCASCNGTFVEKLENPEDDPRQFRAPEAAPDMAGFIGGLHALLGLPQLVPATTQSPSDGATRIQFTTSGPTGSRTFSIGGPNTLARRRSLPRRSSSGVPTMEQYTQRGEGLVGGDPPNITGNMMASYLLAMLGGRAGGPGPQSMAELMSGTRAPGGGQLGDYVYNQEALDQILSQLMETSNVGRPVAAPEDVIKNLPRTVLESDSPLLSKDCAVCKDTFSLDTEDPDEQVVVTLPCKHAFHETCIVPWIKNSGTCPVCRYALVPQPEAHGPPTPAQAGGSGNNSGNAPRGPAGFFSSLLGGSGRSHGSGSQRNRGGPDSSDSPPGGWHDEGLD